MLCHCICALVGRLQHDRIKAVFHGHMLIYISINAGTFRIINRIFGKCYRLIQRRIFQRQHRCHNLCDTCRITLGMHVFLIQYRSRICFHNDRTLRFDTVRSRVGPPGIGKCRFHCHGKAGCDYQQSQQDSTQRFSDCFSFVCFILHSFIPICHTHNSSTLSGVRTNMITSFFHSLLQLLWRNILFRQNCPSYNQLQNIQFSL